MSALEELSPSGYATHDEYFAFRITQGGRTIYSIDLSIPQLVHTIPRPDPAKQMEGNRKITPSRARGFAEYVRERPAFICPPLLMRAPQGEFEFRDAATKQGGAHFGVLAVPRYARSSLNIIDGQHRALGFHLLLEGLEADIQKARGHVSEATRTGDKDVKREWNRRLDDLIKVRKTLAAERVRIDIVIVDDPQDFKQVFVDIADNAKGISGSVKARFDSTKVVNRALDEVLKHPLLLGRIDEETDRVSASSPYLMGAKHVTDIIRAVQVGGTGRVSKRAEAELSEITVARQAMTFLDTLVDSFDDLAAVRDGVLDPAELRRNSLLGSSTMIRALAGAYHDFAHTGIVKDPATKDKLSKKDIEAAFGQLVPTLAVPVEVGSPWLSTGVFIEGTSAPSARAGDVRKLEAAIVEWHQIGIPKTG